MNKYSSTVKTCVKRSLPTRPKNGFQYQLLLNTGQIYSAILSTFIKLPFVIKIFVLSIFYWPFYTGFTVILSTINNKKNKWVWQGIGLIIYRSLNNFNIDSFQNIIFSNCNNWLRCLFTNVETYLISWILLKHIITIQSFRPCRCFCTTDYVFLFSQLD